jgi:thiol-disulfide isomerase/thioredoxin
MRRTLLWPVLVLIAIAFLTARDGRAGERARATGNKQDEKATGGELRIDGELTADDPMDKVLAKSHAKVHPFKMQAGKYYKIEMRNASKIDPILRLEDAKGKQLAFDDDGAGFPNARIIFKAPADGEYRIIATTFTPGQTGDATGKYTLTVGETDAKQLIAEQTKVLQDKGPDVTIKDAVQVMQFAMGLEDGSPDLAAEVYEQAGKLLAKASNPGVVDFGRMIEGAGRRVKLMGQPILVKGQMLDGKSFDWGNYKGKVVLVDFWATWCGPCRAEIPNIKTMYEKYHDKGFDVVAVSIDQKKDKDKVVKYMANEKLPWTCLFDEEPGEGNPALAKYYGIFSIPRAMLVDRDGNVVSMNARGDELERLLEKHLGTKSEAK